MKKIVLVMVLGACVACKQENPQNNSATSTVSSSSDLNVQAASASTHNAPAGSITLALGNVSGKAGEQVCLPCSVADFRSILSIQYTLEWDPALLTFQRIQNFKLPGFGEQNFGTPLAAQGKLTCVWIDESLRGVNLPDGSPIFELCFTVNPDAKSKTVPVRFTEFPTPFESVNLQEQVLTISPKNGSIKVGN